MFDFDAAKGEILIYDVIGDDDWGYVGAGQVREAMKAIGDKKITVRINSPGGSVDEGTAIFNMLKNHPAGVVTIIDSLAASMASCLFMVGDERLIYRNSKAMVHNPAAVAWGDEHALRATADVLTKYKSTIVDLMVSITGKTAEVISADLDAETWLVGQEIIDYGLATGFVDEGESTVEAVVRELNKIAAKSRKENRLPAGLGQSSQSKPTTPLRDAAIAALAAAEQADDGGDEGGLLVDAEAGEMFLHGLIQRGRAAELVGALATGGGEKEWTIRICSFGGVAAEGLALASAIERHPAKIVTIAVGSVASAAVTAFLAGRTRLIEPSASVMIHDENRIAPPNGTSAEHNKALCQQASDDRARQLAAKLGRSYAEVRSWMEKEVWFNAEDSVRFGFASRLTTDPEPKRMTKGELKKLMVKNQIETLKIDEEAWSRQTQRLKQDAEMSRMEAELRALQSQ